MASIKVSCMVMMICMLLMSAHAPFAKGAITCNLVTQDLASCYGYLEGSASSPSKQCCGGVKSLYGSANTVAARKAACNCLKSLASQVSGLNSGNAAALPGKCGVNIPYTISYSTNCNSIKA